MASQRLSKPPAYANGVATDIWVTTMATEQTWKKTKTKISHKSEHEVPAILGFFVIGSFIHDDWGATTELESHWCPFTGTTPNPLLPTMHRHLGIEANEGTSLPASFFSYCSFKIFTGKIEKGAHFICASVFLLKIRTTGSICLRGLSQRVRKGGWPRPLFDILLLCIKFYLTKEVCAKKFKKIVWKT